MNILDKALNMLEKRALCDHCLGRQFALLGYGTGNDERGHAIKQCMTMSAHLATLSNDKEGTHRLNVLATNGFSAQAQYLLGKMKKRLPKKAFPEICHLCQNKLDSIEAIATKGVDLLKSYEYENFLVGVGLPLQVEELEDEFKAEFGVENGEDLRNEFGRLVGKRIAEVAGKEVEFLKPQITVLVNPFIEEVKLQVNPLFISGRYRKLVRNIPQSKWFCSHCRGKGCDRCGMTGKMYPESVEELIGKPILDATRGKGTSFHASGREDIDARMLGTGRPFVIEINAPQKRFLDLRLLQNEINDYGEGKIGVRGLRFADRGTIRKLKGGESAQKEYRVLIEFEHPIAAKDLRLLKGKLRNVSIDQRTPVRVAHRRANLMREKYIYDVNVRKLSPRKAEMKIRCQGGLYVKELVTGDDGRTVPSVSEILKNKAKPLKLDVLRVIMRD